MPPPNPLAPYFFILRMLVASTSRKCEWLRGNANARVYNMVERVRRSSCTYLFCRRIGLLLPHNLSMNKRHPPPTPRHLRRATSRPPGPWTPVLLLTLRSARAAGTLCVLVESDGEGGGSRTLQQILKPLIPTAPCRHQSTNQRCCCRSRRGSTSRRRRPC